MPRPRIQAQPLTPSSFAPFGAVTSSKSSSTTDSLSLSNAKQDLSINNVNPIIANQGTALKYPSVAPSTDLYSSSSSPNTAKPILSLFCCKPRTLEPALSTIESTVQNKAAKPSTGNYSRGHGRDISKHTSGPPAARMHTSQHILRQAVLERHPYTAQTFSPLGLAAADRDTKFLVIVAPPCTKSNSEDDSVPSRASNSHSPDHSSQNVAFAVRGKPSPPPDVTRARAFIAHGDQAVTYAAGTWHAPMVVLGADRVSFLVAQSVNGLLDDDCEEWFALKDRELEVEIEMGWEVWGERVEKVWPGERQGKRAMKL